MFYFADDRWVRIHIKTGDLMTLPEGSYHRFTVDEADMIHAMRLFVGVPVWTPINRPCEEHESRVKYVQEYLGPGDGEEKGPAAAAEEGSPAAKKARAEAEEEKEE